jgi:WD40 repeat protein
MADTKESGVARGTSSTRSEPYVGLVPYSEDDAAFFFGRTSEIQIIIANLITSPLTLLYGPSGVGKSSVLQAGVKWSLRRRSEQSRDEGKGAPEFAVVSISSWRDDPVSEILKTVEDELSRLGRSGPVQGSAQGLKEGLRSATERLGGDLLIILDQFEEYFLYHAPEDGLGTFGVDFPRIVESGDMRVNFLASIREDALARLDLFKGRMTNPFANRLSIDHLDEEHAREAIEGPLAEFNRRSGPADVTVTVEADLVDAVLDQVTTGRVLLGQSGVGTILGGGEGSARRIETPFLQLVMLRVWDEEMAAGSQVLRRSTLDGLGGAERIVRTHLDAAMQSFPLEELDVAASVFHYLVTPSGTKIAHSAEDLAEYTEHGRDEIEPLLEKLSDQDARILRPVAPSMDAPGPTRYEIFHDVLAPAILDWRSRYVLRREQEDAQGQLEEEKQQKLQAETRLRAERRRSRTLRVALAMAMLFVVLLSTVAVFQQRTEARLQLTRARSRELAATAVSALDTDPERGLEFAIDAVRTAPNVQTTGALRKALAASQLVRVIAEGRDVDVESVTWMPDGRVVIGLDNGEIQIRDGATGDKIPGVHDPFANTLSEVNVLDVSSDGQLVVSGSENGELAIAVWDVATGDPVMTVGSSVAIKSVDLSPDGRTILTGDEHGFIRLWSLKTHRPIMDPIHVKGEAIHGVAFSPDGSTFIVGGSVAVGGPSDAHLYHARTGRLIRSFSGHAAGVADVAFSPDGRFLATASGDRTVRLWDTQVEHPTAIVLPHVSRVNALAFDYTGRHLLTADAAGLAQLWDISAQAIVTRFIGHESEINDATVSPDGRYVITASEDGTARIWRAGPGRTVADLDPNPEGEYPVVNASVGGQRVLTAEGPGRAELWDPATGRAPQVGPPGDRAELVWVAQDEAGDRGLLVSSPGIVVQDLPSGALRTFNQDGSVEVNFEVGALSPDGSLALAAGQPNDTGVDVRGAIWDVETGRIVATLPTSPIPPDLEGPAGTRVRGVAWSPDGRSFAMIDVNGSVESWRLADSQGAPLASLLPTRETGQADAGGAVAFSPDGRLLAMPGTGGLVNLLDLTTKHIELTIAAHRGSVSGISFAPNGTFFATAGTDGVVRLWSLPSGNPIISLVVAPGDIGIHEFPDTGVVRTPGQFSPRVEVAADNRTIVVATGAGLTRVYFCDVCVADDDLLALAESFLPVVDSRLG